MSQIYKSGKKIKEKKPKEIATIDISNAFVADLEINLIEFIEGVRTIPEKQIPPKLKKLLRQIQSDVFRFIDQYRMTQSSKRFEDGLILSRGNKSDDEMYAIVKAINQKYKKEHGASKFMPHKLLNKEIEELNEERKEKGETLLREIPVRTYDSWKKRIKSNP
jgi:hypothetical protein